MSLARQTNAWNQNWQRPTIKSVRNWTIGVCLGALAAFSPVYAQKAAEKEGAMFSTEELQTLVHVLGRISVNYVDPIPSKDFLKTVLDGITSKLDAHSSYMTPEEVAEFESQMQQDYAGIGVAVSLPVGEKKGLLINELYPNGEAQKARLQVGDIIVRADGKPLDGVMESNIAKIRGEPGGTVDLVVDREGKEVSVQVKRTKIKTQSVFGAYCECSGAQAYFMRISGFKLDTGFEALEELKKAQSFNPRAFILDLRDNSGGSLSASVQLGSLFLPDGAVVLSEKERGRPQMFLGSYDKVSAEQLTRQAEGKAYYMPLDERFVQLRKTFVSGWPNMKDIPVYVLMNAGSASASEIVAAALRDNHRALLIGEKSFGKGSVQSVVPLPNGGALRLTIARYYTPAGSSIQALGVLPDVMVKDERPWKMQAIEFRKKEYLKNIPNDTMREADLPGHLKERFVSMEEQVEQSEKKSAKLMESMGPRSTEPYEKQFSYAPMGSDGKPDPMSAKALELSMVSEKPKGTRALVARNEP